jgi:hypothetical protein
MSSSLVRAARLGIPALAILVPLALALVLSASAQAAPGKKQKRARALVELRVEGPGKTLDPGTWYVLGSGHERIRRSRPSDACRHGKGRIALPRKTPLGLVQAASSFNRALRQVWVRQDEAGFFVCEIGSVRGRPFTHPDGFAGWTYYVNGVFGSAAADQVRLDKGDRVLWLYNDFGSAPLNTGPRLELRGVPAGTTERTIEVQVIATDFEGATTPASGAEIEGAESVDELGDGRYRVQLARGFSTLRAVREADQSVPSAPVTVCSRPDPDACPAAHGRAIFGSSGGDRISGTRGWDRIRAGGGRDRINLRGGGKDRVNCGGGRDVVLIKRGDRDDRIARNCERVIRTR